MYSTWKICCSGISQRWIITIMSFMAMCIGNGIRVILSITITDMVPAVEKAIEHKDDTCDGYDSAALLVNNFTVARTAEKYVYDWDEYTQGLILSSYFWGYALMQFPFGFLCERFGGKHLLGFGIFLPSILTALIPVATFWGDSTALIVLRIFMGISSSSMFPAVSTLISRWTTPVERTKCCSIVFAGATAGTIAGTVMPAIIIRYTDLGWTGVFYLSGATGILWFPLWCLLCYDSPDKHPFITHEEFKYLMSDYSQRQSSHNKLPAAPWGRILSSKSVWAFFIALFGIDYAYFTIASDLPKYMSAVVKLPIEDNGYLSSLPHFGEWIASGICTWIVNGILEKRLMSVTNVRKVFTALSIMGSASFIIAASYAECNQSMIVILFFSAMALMGCSFPSLMVNALDLSPNYSGTLWAIGNGLASVGGVFTPYVVGLLTPNQTITEWRLVFWIVFALAVVSSLFFVLFGSADVEDWNDPSVTNDPRVKDLQVNTICEKVIDQTRV